MSSSRNHLSSFRFIETLRVRSASQYRGFWFPSRSISFDCLKSLVSRLGFNSTLPSHLLKKGQLFFSSSCQTLQSLSITLPYFLMIAIVKKAPVLLPPPSYSHRRFCLVLLRNPLPLRQRFLTSQTTCLSFHSNFITP